MSPAGGNYLDYDLPSQLSTGGGLTIVARRGSPQEGFSWTSGALTTYGRFELNGGYVQVEATMPTANGSWPAIWLLPGPGAATSTDRFEIDLFEGGMIADFPAGRNFSWHLHDWASDASVGGSYDTGVSLEGGSHFYGLRWEPGRAITWYFDEARVAQVTSSQMAIPDEPMVLILNNGVASPRTGGWHTLVDASTGSSTTMQVSSVQVYR